MAFGVFFLFFWGMMLFAVRPRIEARLQATAEASLPKMEDLSGVDVAFRGRDGVVSGNFTTEEERGRVQSLVASIRVDGARQIKTDFRLRELERDPAKFSFAVKGREILVRGSVATVAEKNTLLAALKSVANGRAIMDELRVSDRTADAAWISGAGALVPVLVGGSEGTAFDLQDGKVRIAGEALNMNCRKAIDEGLVPLEKAGLTIENTLTVATPPEEPSLHLRVSGKTVVLEGLLPKGDAREIVVNGAQRGAAAGTVEDRIKVGDKVSPPRWIEGLGDLLASLLSESQNAEVEISEGGFRLAGLANDGAAKTKLEAMARSVAGPSELKFTSAMTAPAPLDPSSIDLAFSDSELKVTGKVPSDEVRQRIRTAVRRGSGNVALDEKLEPGVNIAEPAWIEALDVFVPHLLINATSGNFRIEHDLVYVSARLPSNEHIEALEGALGAFTKASRLEISEKNFLLTEPSVAASAIVENPETETPDANQESGPAMASSEEAAPMAGRPGHLVPPLFLKEFAIFFGHGTAMMKPADEAQVKRIAAEIKAHPGVGLVVAGFSDSSGNRDFNEWLGEIRADGVRKLLVSSGVDASRLEKRTFSSVGPKNVDKEDPILREFRRVEILVERSSGMGAGSLAPPVPAGEATPVEAEASPAAPGEIDARVDIADTLTPGSAQVDLSENLAPDAEEGMTDEAMDSLFAADESTLAEPSAAVPVAADPEPVVDATPEAPAESTASPTPEETAIPVLAEVPTADAPPPEAPDAPVIGGEVSGTIFFAHGTAMLTSDDRKELRAVAGKLKEHDDAEFLIAGFADRTGDPEFNRWLSEERAKNVKAILADAGVPSSRFSVEVFGAKVATGDPDSEEVQRQNRRVEIRVLP